MILRTIQMDEMADMRTEQAVATRELGTRGRGPIETLSDLPPLRISLPFDLLLERQAHDDVAVEQ